MHKTQLYILFFTIFLPVLAFSQTRPVKKLPVKPVPEQTTPQDTTKNDKVVVDHSDFAEGVFEDEKEMRYLKGNVELRQDDVYMYCDTATIENNNVIAVGNVIIQQGDSVNVFSDSLVYQGGKKVADLYGDVVLESNEQKLFTTELNYDLQTKVAKYTNGATLTDSTTQLTSKIGYFYLQEDRAFFKDSVQVVDTAFTLRSDTLEFDTDTKIAYFHGPTIIVQNESKIYCESGFYNTTNSDAKFLKNPQYIKGTQKATADSIFYSGETKEVFLEGNARIVDEDKIAIADKIRYDEKTEISYLEGNAHFEDANQVIDSDKIIFDAKNEIYTTQGRSRLSDPPQILEADNIDFNNETETGLAQGNVYWQDTSAHLSIVCERADYDQKSDYILASGGRPFLTTLMDDDSLFLTADTLRAFRQNPEDSARTLVAYQDVRIFKSDIQGVCDSLIYNQADSIFRFYDDPILWSDTTQFSADTLHMLMSDNQIDKIFLYENSFIINSPEEVYFNQIKGKNITAFFQDSQLRRMKVDGNAESVYYIQDDVKAYIGANKTICSEMMLFFGNNEVENIRFYNTPKATMYPMGQANHSTTLRLPGFRWVTDRRPMSLEDLFTVREKKPEKETEKAALKGDGKGSLKEGLKKGDVKKGLQDSLKNSLKNKAGAAPKEEQSDIPAKGSGGQIQEKKKQQTPEKQEEKN